MINNSTNFLPKMGKRFARFELLFFDGFFFFDRKYSSEQRDLDDADEDDGTVYRGLAVPVDIRQVVEVELSRIFFFVLNIHL